MTNEPVSAAEIYDAFADEYRTYSETKSAYISSVDQLIKEQFSDQVQIMLDFGAGDGVRGAALAKNLNVKSLFQVDISPQMVLQCQNLKVAKKVYLGGTDDWVNGMPTADFAVCLWNVLGHIPSREERVARLRDINSALKPGGYLCLDVNNRHNSNYGLLRSYGRRILDAIWPDERRGDISFSWKIGDKTYPANGHFFTPIEIKSVISEAGFSIDRIATVDYTNGAVSDNLMNGQIFIVAKKCRDFYSTVRI